MDIVFIRVTVYLFTDTNQNEIKIEAIAVT